MSINVHREGGLISVTYTLSFACNVFEQLSMYVSMRVHVCISKYSLCSGFMCLCGCDCKGSCMIVRTELKLGLAAHIYV